MTVQPPPLRPSKDAAGTAPEHRPSRSRFVLGAAALTLVSVTILAGVGLLARKDIARVMAQAWLRSRGVESDVRIERLDLQGLTAQVRLGSEQAPDFVVDRIEVDLGPAPARSGQGFGQGFSLAISAVRLTRPRLVVALDGQGHLGLARLQPLMDALAAQNRTPTPDVPPLSLEDATVWLQTPDGRIVLRGNGEIIGGRLRRFDGAVAPFRLAANGLLVRGQGGPIRAVVAADRLQVQANLSVDELISDALGLEGAKARIEAALPYPAGAGAAPTGPLTLTAALLADGIHRGALNAEDAELNVRFDGQSTGQRVGGQTITGRLVAVGRSRAFSADQMAGRGASVRLVADGVSLSGSANRTVTTALTVNLSADKAAYGGAFGARITAQLSAPALTGRLSKTGFQVSGDAVGAAQVQRLVLAGTEARQVRLSGDITGLSLKSQADQTLFRGNLKGAVDGATVPSAGIVGATLRLQGPVGWTARGLETALTLSGRATGAMTPGQARDFVASLPLLGTDPGQQTALTAALRAYQLSAPALTLDAGALGTRLRLVQPLRVSSHSGASATVSAAPGAPVWTAFEGGAEDGTMGGALGLQAQGGGVPTIQLAIPRWRSGGQGLSADLDLTAALDLAPAKGLTLAVRGLARQGQGGDFQFRPVGCAHVTAKAIVTEAEQLQATLVDLCAPASGILLSAGPKGFGLEARFDRLSTDVVQAGVRITDAKGSLSLSGDETGLTGGDVQLQTAAVSDQAKARRFEALGLQGRGRLTQGVWRGEAAARTLKGHQALAQITLRHVLASGHGEARIETSDLAFAKGGLQPRDLTPLAAFIADAEGRAQFEGRFDWTDRGMTSSGLLQTDGLDYRSAFGPVRKVRTRLVFDSLSPLTTLPGQSLGVERVDSTPPVGLIATVFGLTPERLILQSGSAAVAGGQVRIEGLSLPLDPAKAFAGTLIVDGVDLGALLAASPLASQIKMTAIVDGSLPFTSGPEGFRFRSGQVKARGAGRLSIARTALTGVQTADARAPGAPAAAVPTNAIQDFAYQAMENMAFDVLEASVASRDGGRLGMVFHVKGRNDPVKDVPSRIALFDLLRGKAFDKPIALPKGTPVDLTLDTSINFDEIMALMMQTFDRSQSRSAPVQP